MEIEIPRRAAHSLIWALLAIGLIVLGLRASPVGANGRPLLLTPRLAEINGYRQDIQRWGNILSGLDGDLGEILADSSTDLFSQNEEVERVYSRLQSLTAEIESRNIPPTLDQVHEFVSQTASAYLQAASLTAAWIAEPVEKNQQAAAEALDQAHNLLEQLLANPWIETKP